jgi:putative transposase
VYFVSRAADITHGSAVCHAHEKREIDVSPSGSTLCLNEVARLTAVLVFASNSLRAVSVLVETESHESSPFTRKKRSFECTTDSRTIKHIAPNVLARSIVHCRCAKSQVGYRCKFDLHRRSWMYLAAVIELISRRIVGYAMSESNDTRLALRALNSAKAARGRIDRLLHHSDRGSPDGSDLYIDRFCALHVQPSMSESGDCWDNAVAERFFGIREWELLRKRSFATHSQARRVVIAYIDQFFNLISRHSVNGYLTESSSNFAGNHVSSRIIDVSTNLRQAQALHFDTISSGLWRFLVSARFIRNSF